tara:strand:+ start:231 stop:524 length:294 start_codon:yes stop_codon:yes gene_type:complete
MTGVDFPATTGTSGGKELTLILGFGVEGTSATEVGLGRNDGVDGLTSKGLASLDTFRSWAEYRGRTASAKLVSAIETLARNLSLVGCDTIRIAGALG